VGRHGRYLRGIGDERDTTPPLPVPNHSSENEDGRRNCRKGPIWTCQRIVRLEARQGEEHPNGLVGFTREQMLIAQSRDQHGESRPTSLISGGDDDPYLL